MTRLKIVAAALALGLAAPSLAAAQQVASSMTCEQARATYERNGVIHVLANGSTVVPLRVGVPVARAANLTCNGRGAVAQGYSVRTTDDRHCIIAMRC